MPDVYEIGESGEAFTALARNIAQNTASPHAPDVDQQGRFPHEALAALAEAGFFGLCLTEAPGGKDQPPRVFAAVVEELAQGCPSAAMIYVMHVAAARVIAASPVLKRKDELLGEMAAGRHLTTLAFSERGSRSQFWAPVSQLVEDGDGYTATALKSWVTSARLADSFVCSAQRPGAGSPLDSTLYLARREANGVSVQGAFDGLGLRGNDSAPLAFDGLRVSADDLLTEQGAGAPVMLEVVLPWFSIGTAAMANGLCRAAVTATAGHLSNSGFEHTGSQLRDLPNLRARLAAMSVRTEQSRALLSIAARAVEQPNEQTSLLVLQARLAAIEAALEVTDLAMKACGGAAFSRHLGIERIFRDARAGWVMAPTADHLHDFIGRALTGLPLFD